MDEIITTVRAYIVDQLLQGAGGEDLTPSTPLVTGGILDSLASVNLVGFLEKTYDIEVAAHEVNVENLDTLTLIAQLVLSKQTG